MLIYFLLLGAAALFALAVPTSDGQRVGLNQTLAFAAFGLFYFLVATLRYEIGGDWFPYLVMLDDVRTGALGETRAWTDPAFGLLLVLSSAVGGGIYLVNGICALILFYGVVRVAIQTKEPWLALTVAVPYLLIVVGMGYVRQAAAIGLVLAATDAVRRERPSRAIVQLGVAVMFHSTAIVALPLFAMALANRNKLRILILSFRVLGGRIPIRRSDGPPLDGPHAVDSASALLSPLYRRRPRAIDMDWIYTGEYRSGDWSEPEVSTSYA